MKLKILQLNIWFGGKNREQLLRFIDKHNFDLLIFQEVYKPQPQFSDPRYRLLTDLKELHEYHFIDFAPNFFMLSSVEDEVVNTDLGTAILSKYPILKSTNTFYLGEYSVIDAKKLNGDYSKLPRTIQHVAVDINGNTLNVVTTHGIWGFDDKDNPARLSMSKAIIDAVMNFKNVVLSGDLNVDQNTKTISEIERHLHNPFKNKLTSTFNMKYKSSIQGTFNSSVVDFLFVSPGVRVISAETTGDADISDHIGLMCEIEVH